jgi:hypothetical protein
MTLFGYPDTLCDQCHGFGPTVENCDHADWQSQGWDVAVPAHVIWAALAKARQLYLAVAAQQGSDPGPETECWSEFETLREYAQTEKRIAPGMTDLRGL